MGGLLRLVQRGGEWAGPQPAHAPPHCTKRNSPMPTHQRPVYQSLYCCIMVRCSATYGASWRFWLLRLLNTLTYVLTYFLLTGITLPKRPKHSYNVGLCTASKGAATGRIQWHVTLQAAANWWIHCHDSRATWGTAGCSLLTKSMSRSCHIAGCKNSIHQKIVFTIFYFIFVFLMQFGLWLTSGSFRIIRYTCLKYIFRTFYINVVIQK